MCTVCGCGTDKSEMDGHSHDHSHPHEHSHETSHSHAPGVSSERMVKIEQNILSKNSEYAQLNRQRLLQMNLLALNLVSSPGSGKTAVLTRTIEDTRSDNKAGVIEGDQQTSNDAERIRETGAPAIQINTGKGCHLDAHMVGHAFEQLPLESLDTIYIENVGNLVCPAAFDLGEMARVVILSVTEGEDKPLKYPDMFYGSELMLLNKADLLPYLDFDVDRCIEYARRINPEIKVIQCSAKTGEGMADWYHWVSEQRAIVRQTSDKQTLPKQEKPEEVAIRTP